MEHVLFSYKGYYGNCNYSKDDSCYYGKILDIEDIITYEADSINKLYDTFSHAVDDLLDNLSFKNVVQ